MSTGKKFVTYFLPLLLWMAFIFPVWNRALGSSRIYEIFADVFRWLAPGASAHALGVWYIVFRKTLHFIEYGLLAFLFYRAFRGGRGPRWSKKAGILAAVSASAYGFLDEFLQSFVPNRFGSPFDWGVDTAGVLAAVGLLAWMGGRRDADPGSRAGRALFLKRPFDVALSRVGLVLSSPLWLVIALAIWLEDRGPRLLRAGAGRPERARLQGPQVPLHGQGRGDEDRAGPGRRRRPPRHPGRPDPAGHGHGRAAPARQHLQGRHELRRAPGPAAERAGSRRRRGHRWRSSRISPATRRATPSGRD